MDTPTKPPQAKPAAEGESWAELAKTVIYAGLIAVVIRTFLFQPFNIPSASMEATLLVGDYLFVEKFSYGYSRYTFPFGGWPFGDSLHGRMPDIGPSRGDVVVFKFPQDNSTDFIKRLIGLPGDRIQMRDGVLWLNGSAVPKVRVQDYVETVDGEEHHVPQYRETLPGGKSYLVLDRFPEGARKWTHPGEPCKHRTPRSPAGCLSPLNWAKRTGSCHSVMAYVLPAVAR